MKKSKKQLTSSEVPTTLSRMQPELDAISAVEPNVEKRLDRIFNRAGELYGGDYGKFFEDLDTANAEALEEEDMRLPLEALSSRLHGGD